MTKLSKSQKYQNYNTGTTRVTMYDITKNEFQELTPLPYGAHNMATVKYKENVVLAGCFDFHSHSCWDKINNVVSYNVETQKTTNLPPMPFCRSQCCAVVDGNSLVVMGGNHLHQGHLSSVVAFDFRTSPWRNLPSMNEARRGFIAEII